MKTIYAILMASTSVILFTSCKKDSGTVIDIKPLVTLPHEIRSDRTLKGDTVYTFASGVLVTNNAVLTIEPGTIIKSNNGEDANNARAFVIDRGAKIMAIGTADNPIVFTS